MTQIKGQPCPYERRELCEAHASTDEGEVGDDAKGEGEQTCKQRGTPQEQAVVFDQSSTGADHGNSGPAGGLEERPIPVTEDRIGTTW